MTPEERALLTLTIVCADADMIGGGHYSPDLRDCLHDAANWVGPIIAVAIREAESAARSAAFEEAAKVAQRSAAAWGEPQPLANFSNHELADQLTAIASAIRDLKTKGE